MAQSASDEVQVGGDALGLGGGGTLVARLHLGDHAGLQADVDLFGGAGGLEQAGDLVEALLLGGHGAGGVLGGSAGLAADGGLQVLQSGAHLGNGLGNHVEVAGVLSGRNNVTQIHGIAPSDSSSCFGHPKMAAIIIVRRYCVKPQSNISRPLFTGGTREPPADRA